MLVLTRKQQEKIRIGDDIVITVLKTKGSAVRLGIEAPANVSVLRGELVAELRSPSHQPDPAEPVADAAQGAGRRENDRRPAPEVRFGRVPRSRVGVILPHLLGEAAPLRRMLAERRAESAV